MKQDHSNRSTETKTDEPKKVYENNIRENRGFRTINHLFNVAICKLKKK